MSSIRQRWLASKYGIKDVKALYRFCIVTKYKVNSNKFNGIAQLTVRVEDIVETLKRNYVQNFKTNRADCIVYFGFPFSCIPVYEEEEYLINMTRDIV